MASTSATPFALLDDQAKFEALRVYLEQGHDFGLDFVDDDGALPTAQLRLAGKQELADVLAGRSDGELLRWRFDKHKYVQLDESVYYCPADEDDRATDVPVPSPHFAKLRAALPPQAYRIGVAPSEGDLLAWALAGYEWKYGKADTSKPAKATARLVLTRAQVSSAAAERVLAFARGHLTFRDVIRTRTNQFPPAVGANWMHWLGDKYRARVRTVCAPDELAADFLLAYEVGKGSKIDPPNVTILEWSHPEPVLSLDLVGKGVCFDTGGHNLKHPADVQDGMYTDKGGATAQVVLAELIMSFNLPIRLRLACGWVVNVPGAYATMQNSIHRSGDVTIENGNTDAEGRLVMGAILSYLAKRSPAEITITQATLTGAAVVGLGEHIAAMYCGDKPLADTLRQAMVAAQDPVWHMPRDRRVRDRLAAASDADFASVLSRYGGSLTADCFLSVLAAPTTKFVHIDQACACTGSPGFTPEIKDRDMFAVRGLFTALQQLCAQQ